MAREVGLRSFKAEEISFSKSGPDGKDGSPWRLIQRRIPKNILLAAYRNPLSLEELCLELGISMPYMEEEVKLLVEGTLLKEVKKDHFETDFIIVDREMQRKIFLSAEETAVKFAPLLIELLDAALPELENVLGKRWERSFLLWTLIPMAVDLLQEDVIRANAVPEGYTKRPHEGEWDIVGYEAYDYPYSIRFGHNGTGQHLREIMWFYKIGMHGLWDRAGEMYSHEVSILASVIRDNRKLSELSVVEQEVMRELVTRGFMDLQDDVFVPSFPVFSDEQFTQFRHLVSLQLYTELQAAMDVLYKSIYAIIGRDVPARLNEQLKFVSGTFLFFMRMMCLRYALDKGHIHLPEDPGKSTIAMYMMLD